MECVVCTRNFNLSTRAKTTCYNPQCGFEVCKECLRTYLCTTKSMPKCMKCNTGFQLTYLVKHLNRSFVYDTYKPFLKDILLATEMAKMPETMPFAEAEKERRRLRKMNEEFNEKIAKFERQIERFRAAKEANLYRMRGEAVPARYAQACGDLLDGGPVLIDTKKKFIMACPSACKGFLSTAYKCSLCDKFTCPECFVVMPNKASHVCVESDKLSAELIRKETRPCPSCGERIYKVSGCDQMFCTSCQTAFSWKTGNIETGTIHNPHFYELQRAGGAALRNVGDVQCGGMPDIRNVRQTLQQIADFNPGNLAYKDLDLRVRTTFQRLAEHTAYTVNEYRARTRTQGDSRPLRVQFILDDISSLALKDALYKQDKDRQKTLDLYHIMEIIGACGIEAFRDIVVDTPHPSAIVQCVASNPNICAEVAAAIADRLNTLDKVRLYCNDELAKVSVTYNCSVQMFSPNFGRNTVKSKVR
jgi:hypothetical protein